MSRTLKGMPLLQAPPNSSWGSLLDLVHHVWMCLRKELWVHWVSDVTSSGTVYEILWYLAYVYETRLKAMWVGTIAASRRANWEPAHICWCSMHWKYPLVSGCRYLLVGLSLLPSFRPTYAINCDAGCCSSKDVLCAVLLCFLALPFRGCSYSSLIHIALIEMKFQFHCSEFVSASNITSSPWCYNAIVWLIDLDHCLWRNLGQVPMVFMK